MFDRWEWPTPGRIERLREAGAVPYSRAATVFFTAAVVLLSGLGWRSLLQRWGKEYVEFWRSISELDWASSAPLRRILAELTEGMVLFNLLVAGGLLFFGLLQTKFIFQAGWLRLDFSRLPLFGRPDPGRLFERCLGGGLVLCVGVVLVGGGGYLLAPLVLGVMTLPADEAPGRLGAVFLRMLPVGSLGLLIFALAGWLSGRFSFAWRHRMSREEIDQESRQSD